MYVELKHAVGSAVGAAVWLAVIAASAAGTPHIAPSVPREPGPTNTVSLERRIDRWHGAVGSYVTGFGEGMDAFLAAPFKDRPHRRNGQLPKLINDPSLIDETRSSRVRVSPSTTLREGEGFGFDIGFNAKLRLPRFSDRLELLVDSQSREESVLDDLERDRTTTRPADNDSDGVAALRYLLKETLNFRASIIAGLKFRPEPVPGIGLRLRGHHDFDGFTTRLTQSFFYETEDGFGEKTQFDIDQQERQNFLRRLTTTVLWSEASDGVAAGQSLSYYKYLTNRRVAGFRIGATGHLEPEALVENYNARLIYRQRIHREWLFVELEPGIDWPRDRDFEETPYAKLKFDIIFGDWGETTSNKE